MPQSLRARLTRIRNAREQDSGKDSSSSSHESTEAQRKKFNLQTERIAPCFGVLGERNLGKDFSTWHESGCKVLRRTLILPFALPAILPQALPWLLPDLSRNQQAAGALSGNGNFSVTLPDMDKFLFFDLETTGLSGGAGTVAFLAAFGRFIRKPDGIGVPAEKAQKKIHAIKQQQDYTHLEVTQFLLLDYPGESDFLAQTLSFISSPAEANPYFLTTYNGKAFDIPLLKTRCLMNGLTLPRFFQLDLLHPARRLWKRMLPSCSQAVVETHVLGLDRTGDTPGSMAPDIWFNFLRSGEGFSDVGQGSEASRALLEICEHNVKDIFGLASLFRSFTEIAASPLDAAERFNVDEENLAVHWRRHLFRQKPEKNTEFCETKSQAYWPDQKKTTTLLLEAAAKNYPRSCLRLGFDLFRQGCYKEGRVTLKRIVTEASWKVPCTAAIKAMALRSLAIDAQRRLGHRDLALVYIEQTLTLVPSLPAGLREDLEMRHKRLKYDKM